MPLALEAYSFNQWTTREIPAVSLYVSNLSLSDSSWWPSGMSPSTATAGLRSPDPLPSDTGTWGPVLLQGHYTRGQRHRVTVRAQPGLADPEEGAL